MPSPTVQVTGLREVNAALRATGKEAPKEMREEFRKIIEPLARVAAGKYPSVTGRAARSVTPRASATGAGIAFGGSRAPYAPWLDFGGAVGRKRSIVRPFVRQGRYVYPTVMDARDNLEEAAGDAVLTVARRHGFDTDE